MEIAITDNKTIEELQDEFRKHYPWLKLEFFSQPHEVGKSSNYNDRLDNQIKLANCRSIHNKGVVSIRPHRKVRDIEQDFQDTYGLNVQIFCKMGDTWIETVQTDRMTLSQQSELGALFA